MSAEKWVCRAESDSFFKDYKANPAARSEHGESLRGGAGHARSARRASRVRQAGGGRRASMVSLLIGLCVFASTDLCVHVVALTPRGSYLAAGRRLKKGKKAVLYLPNLLAPL